MKICETIFKISKKRYFADLVEFSKISHLEALQEETHKKITLTLLYTQR